MLDWTLMLSEQFHSFRAGGDILYCSTIILTESSFLASYMSRVQKRLWIILTNTKKYKCKLQSLRKAF